MLNYCFALNNSQYMFGSSKSQLKTIRDTSGFASSAVEDWINQDCSITAFRYQARLGVGKHFTQFVWFLLPFYVALKFWWFLTSILVGFVGGQLFLYVVFNCRKRFNHNIGRVAIGASTFIAICSSICFMFGVWVIHDVWRVSIAIGSENVLLPIAFFSWLVIFWLFLGLKHCEHQKLSTEEMDDQLFEETGHVQPQDAGANDEEVEVVPNETKNAANRRQYMHKDSMNAAGHGYFYHTGKKA